ncbi:MAG TPA: GAF domain-containing protein, partial [Allocoleopsis sp.]
KREDLDSFFGLRYPATDVPKPARRLYLLNYIRLIPDINYENIALPPHPETDEPFDLSYATLRSVSPIHVEYLGNMGVKASMSISLIHENKLWGLVACHNYTPKYLSYEVRSACEFLGKVMSLNIVAKEEQENLQTKIKLKSNSSELFDNLSQTMNIRESLLENIDLLSSLVEAQGMVLCLNGELSFVGITPQQEEVIKLVQWVRKQYNQELFYIDCLSQLYPPALEFQDIASGILILFLNRVDNSYLIWFRPEVEHTVTWAGNPNKDVKVENDGTLTLSPRKSFELWKENVAGKSLLWEDYQIKQVMEFRNLLVDIIFKKSHELVELNLELQRSNDELDAFAYIASHDLKEPLRGIFNYSYILLEDYQNQLDEQGVNKLNTLMTLTKRMEKLIDALLYYSRLGRQDISLQTINIEALIVNEIKLILEASQQEKLDIRIPRPIPKIKGDKT